MWPSSAPWGISARGGSGQPAASGRPRMAFVLAVARSECEVRAAEAIYAGYVVHCPLGGYVWQAIHYLHGLRDAGVEPFFCEDTRHTWEAFDPIHRTSGTDYEAGLALAGEAFGRAGFGDSWAFFDAERNKWAGAGRDATYEAFAKARILVNAGGVHRFGAPERAGKTNVYIDMDPAYTQIRLAGGDRVLRELLHEHDVHFTFGENIGSSNCRIPTGGGPLGPPRPPGAGGFLGPGAGAARTAVPALRGLGARG